jgi:hypothetical protein
MSDTDDPEARRDQLDAEKRAMEAVEALRANYYKALQQLRLALQREAELQSLWAKVEGDAHSFD